MPEDMKPSIGTSNAEELIFDKIDCGYLVSVASHDGAGRSATAQALHCSEAAFWPDLEMQFASLLQTVPDADGTEIILEVTACGYNSFHQSVEKGRGWRIPISCRSSCPGRSTPTIGERLLLISRWTPTRRR